MFVFLSKLLAPLVYPLGAAALLWFAAAALHWRGRRRGAARAAVAGIALVLTASNPYLAEALLGSLEAGFAPRPVEAYPVVDAIVVLGGATSAPIPPRTQVEVGDAFDRLLHGIQLLRAGRAPRLVLSGGAISYLEGSDMPEAERLAILARGCGVDEQDLVLEPQARNTYENGLYTARLLRGHGWDRILLVTSAAHMRRALAVFRRQGYDAVPAPADVAVVPKPFSPVRLLPDADALRASTQAVKEYLGLLVYRLRGWA